MQPSDVTMWGRDYSAREFSHADFLRYQRENPNERPVQWLDRYIGYPTNPKCISHYPGMYQHHWSSGRPVSLFHQIGYGDMAGGYEGGRQHAAIALADARRVGWDGESHITACMDRFYAKAGFPTLNAGQLSEYMRGFRSVLGDRTGFYGFYDSMRDAINGGWASFYVQCGARSAHVPGIHAWQENNYQPKVFGTPTDILELYASPAYAFGGTEMDLSTKFKRWAHADEEGPKEMTVEELFRYTESALHGLYELFFKIGSVRSGGDTYDTNGTELLRDVDRVQLKVDRIEAKLDALSGTLSNDEANIIAAMRQGGVDPKAFAEAVAPLMPKAPSAAENAKATVDEFKKPGN